MKKLFLLMLCTCCCSLISYAQNRVGGVVTDYETRETLLGVNIRVKGSEVGTVTDENGSFSLQAPPTGTLIVSYLGYKTQEININGRTILNIPMYVNPEMLEEVVVIGYGTQRKSDLTGSVVSVTSKDVRNYAVSNVSQLLTGKAAGVYVASSTGQPGANTVIRIRGLGTVNDNNPLYVVDGQPLDNINSLNPNDIDRVEILKDASAAAIYGSRGSNGVILVTTKKGVAGETEVSLDAYIGFKTSYKALAMCNSEELYHFMKEGYANGGGALDPNFDKLYQRGYDTDWWDEMTRTGFNQNYNLSIRKGTDTMRSSLSIGYMGDEGAIITTKFERLSLRLNLEYDVNRYLTVGTNLGVSKITSRDASALPRFDFILQADPFTPVINPLVDPSIPDYEYNKYAPTEWAFNPNPVAIINLNDRKTRYFNVYGNLFANVNLFKGLTYRFQYSFERNNSQYSNFLPVYTATFSEYNLANRENKYNTVTQLNNNTGFTFNTVIENQLNYNYSSADHNLNVMAATTYESFNSETVNAFKREGPGNDEAYRVLSAQTSGDQTSGSKTETAILSYLGRVNYSYKDTYLATVSFRADGSSKFASGNRWGYFPSFSLGWRISNETFFKNLNIENTIENLKLRAGWGQNGNQRISSNAALTLIGTSTADKWYFGNGYTQAYLPKNVGNPDIKWETSQQFNVGMDLIMFNNKLDMNLDYFIKKTNDMLLEVPVPEVSAYPNSPWSNAGDVENRGFEANINFRSHIGQVGFNVGANLSTYKTKVTKLTSDVDYYLTGTVSRTYVGGPMARFYGYKVLGIFQNQAEIDNYTKNGEKIQPLAQPGDFKFADLDGSGAIDADDRDFIGDPNPKLIYGFNMGFTYRDFDLSMFFQGVLGNDIWNTTKTLSEPTAQNALKEAYTGAWRKEGDKATYPRISTLDHNNNLQGSDWFVEKGSFLRLQNIQLGYNLPGKLCNKTDLISSLRIYVSGQNLLTLTKYSGVDPEIGSDNPMNMGLDDIRYPASRVVTFGVNVTF